MQFTHSIMNGMIIILLVAFFCHVTESSGRYNYNHRMSGKNFYRQRGRNYNGLPPIFRPPVYPPPVTTPVDPGTTPNIDKLSNSEIQAQGRGVRVPPNECVISWNDFKQKIADKEWIGIYGIDDDDEINPGDAFKFSVRWQVQNETIIRRQGSLWFNGKCVFADGLFRRIDDSRAIFGSIGGNVFATSNRRDYFVCSKREPIQWCIFYICYDSQNVRDGRCPNSETIAVFREQRDSKINDAGIREGPIRLNDIDWTEFERTFKECFSQEIKDDQDPQIFWSWRTPNNEACAVPGTRAFDEGVAAG